MVAIILSIHFGETSISPLAIPPLLSSQQNLCLMSPFLKTLVPNLFHRLSQIQHTILHLNNVSMTSPHLLFLSCFHCSMWQILLGPISHQIPCWTAGIWPSQWLRFCLSFAVFPHLSCSFFLIGIFLRDISDANFMTRSTTSRCHPLSSVLSSSIRTPKQDDTSLPLCRPSNASTTNYTHSSS